MPIWVGKKAGAAVLQRVARDFMLSPQRWCTGWARSATGAVVRTPVMFITVRRLRTCSALCLDAAITLAAADMVRVRWKAREMAREARSMIYNHLGVPHQRRHLWDWNDTQTEVGAIIDMLFIASVKADASTEPRLSRDKVVRNLHDLLRVASRHYG